MKAVLGQNTRRSGEDAALKHYQAAEKALSAKKESECIRDARRGG
jgi:hypothetical protein